eukprot:g3481.t1
MRQELGEKISLIPILRAGLGMADAMLELLPMSNTHHLGMYRDKTSLIPTMYYNKLPPSPDCERAFILEPMIATAGTLVAAVDLVKDWGVKKITVLSILASKAGLKKLCADHPDIEVVVGHVDEELSATGQIVPGLGDIGDRLYCPGNKDRVVDSEKNSPRPRKKLRT